MDSKESILKPLGAKLVKLRKSQRYPQSMLAERAGVSRYTLREIERGSSNPSVEVLQKICHALGVELVLEISEGSTADK